MKTVKITFMFKNPEHEDISIFMTLDEREFKDLDEALKASVGEDAGYTSVPDNSGEKLFLANSEIRGATYSRIKRDNS